MLAKKSHTSRGAADWPLNNLLSCRARLRILYTVTLEVAMDFVNEPALIEAAKGDHGPSAMRQAWNTIVTKYKGLMRKVAYDVVHADDLVDEIVQYSLERAFVAIKRFEPHRKFSAWLAAITHHAALNFLRNRRRRHKIEEEIIRPEMPTCSEPDAETRVWRSEVNRQQQLAILNALNSDQRETIRLRYGEGASYEEIAAATGVKTGTVVSRLSRAKDALALALPHYLDPEDCTA